MEALSEILASVKLNGAIFFTAEFSAPWGMSVPTSQVTAARVAPGAERLVLYHLVLEGGASIELTDGPTLELVSGDNVVFPQGAAHRMSSGTDANFPYADYGFRYKILSRDLCPLRAGGGGRASRFVCGYMSCV